MATTIATALNQCLKQLTESTSSGALARYENEVSQRRWSDELGRLRIWAGNIGAHQTGQSSLDHRLRDASHLKSETVNILQRMLRVLQSLTDVINEQEEDEVQIDDSFLGTSDMELDDENNETDIQVLYQSLRNIINLLFRISMAIRRPADHDRLLGVKIKNASFFEPWAQQHVSHKFPHADENTTQRLSAAMARQKAVLKYFERHKAKLSKGLASTGETESNYLSETVATEMALADDMDQLQFLETHSTSGVSQTSYAPSMFTANESLSIPNAPKESADNNPFECPYCCLMITIRNTQDWARHIFRDLMPYVCLSPECITPSKLYGSRRQWYQHICEAHSTPKSPQGGLNCPLCHVNIQPPLTFERHVGNHMEQLALFFLPRIDPKEDAESEAESEPMVSELAEYISGPGSDSDEVESPNDSDHPFTHTAAEDPRPDRSHDGQSEVHTNVPNSPYSQLLPLHTRRGSTGDVIVLHNDRSNRSRGASRERPLQEWTEVPRITAYDPNLNYIGRLSRRDFGIEFPDERPKSSEKGDVPDADAYSYTAPREHRNSNSDADTSDEALRNYRSKSRQHGERRDRHKRRVAQTRKVDGSDITSLHTDEQPLQGLQPSPSPKDTTYPRLSESDKRILKAQQSDFSEDPKPVREGVAPLKQGDPAGIPPGARWTKVDRRLVNPEALEAGNERFEESSDYVMILRVLTKEEILAYATKTQEIRGMSLLSYPCF
ncbi:hypothetical protein PENVUL_c018G03184 [Penicillium vulpinum]|uniref:C2H2-type domain-containing protein n=1 Tax=Penicillium vulpinum TaxID=29845 RepID=A0A1V6RXP8_9EURO|nr:hypothetical protein PENVUL_c018G03184 [Penicillium vulpinum]